MGNKKYLFEMMMKRVGFKKDNKDKVFLNSKFFDIVIVEIRGSIFAVDRKCYKDYIESKIGDKNEH